jgi:hypothetical protein
MMDQGEKKRKRWKECEWDRIGSDRSDESKGSWYARRTRRRKIQAEGKSKIGSRKDETFE